MNTEAVIREFRNRVCEQVTLEPDGVDRFRVFTPFRFEDGDHFTILLKREDGHWLLTDEADTLMHLSYWLDEKQLESEGNRHEIIRGSLAGFSVQDRNGEFIIPVDEERYGDALFNFVQALTKVSDVSFLSRERVRSTFLEDLRAFIQARVPSDRLEFDWTDKHNDRKGRYPVDFRVNSMDRPLFIYGLPGETQVRDATICLLTFERWGLNFQSMGVFEEQETIGRTTLARFTDVCDKAFSSLDENRERIETHLNRILKGKS